jgi:hypothetical protein
MDIKKVKGGRGNYGSAQIRLTKKSVMVKFDDKKDEDGNIIEKGKDFEIERENAPDNVEAGHWSTAVSSDGTKLFSIRPLVGTFDAKFVKFAAAKDAQPAPELEPSTYRNDKGQVVPGKNKLVFTAIIEVGGEYEYPCKLPYLFSEGDNGNVQLTYRKMGPRISQMIDFLDVCGVKDSAIPYTENILPHLQEMILDEDRTFNVVIKNGWIDSFNPPLVERKKKVVAKKRKVAK